MSKPYLPTLLLLLLLLPLAVIFFPVKLLAQWIPIMVLGIAMYFTKTKWFDQWRIRRKLELQGIRGPKPGFLYGNAREMKKIQASLMMEKKSSSVKNGEFVAHDYTSTLFPYFEQWRKEYGSIYTYSAGNKQHLYVNHPDLVKEMNYSMSWDLGKPSYVSKKYAPMLGNGVLRSNGHTWAHQRKIIAPEFFMDKVKGMTGLMLEAAEEVASKWERCIEAEDSVVKMAEINVQYDLRSAAADVISKTCFGSSYLKGKEIFSKLRTLQNLLCEQGTIFSSPALGLFSFGGQKKIDHLEEEVDSLIWNVVKERERACHQEENKDLLQLIMEGAMNSNMSTEDSSRRFIIDNCKNIYFAGHETTAITASWCLMLLALYPQWQEQIRAEVAQVCATTGSLDGDSIHKLKTVTMVIHEVLRLYPPAAFVSREALQETQIGHIVVPKGVCLWTLIPTLHRDPDIWGPNVNEFNPERFANGISNACKLPQVYIPFGVGPRLCLGKNFALVQLKIMVAHIISKFTFSLSPKYRHSPVYRMIVEPAQGVQLLVKKKPNS